MIKRKSTTCCLDINETASVLELKKKVGGIMKKNVEDIKLLKDQQVTCATAVHCADSNISVM